MSTFGWIGSSDTNADWMPASGGKFHGAAERLSPALGQFDTSGDWMPTSGGKFVGTMQVPFYWVGQLDTAGDWMDANGIYTGQTVNIPPFPPSPTPPVEGGIVPPLFGTFYGLTWLKNIAVLGRDYWDGSLTTPYSGQLYPVPNSGGTTTGQIYPY
jgi:hypothetical protein